MTISVNIDDEEIVGYISSLFKMALGFFTLTTIIGLLNVFNIPGIEDFIYSRPGILLFHLHAGTIAWISTGIACSIIWIFSNGRDITDDYKNKVKRFYIYWQAVIPTYAIIILVSFQFQFFLILPIFAILTVGGFLWAAYFAYTESTNVEVIGVPHLSFVVGLAFAGYAGLLGTLLGIQHVVGQVFIPGDGIGGHASGMEIGYVFIVIFGIAEWQLKGENLEPLSISGISQVAILALSALFSSLGILFNIEVLTQLSLPLEIIALIIFFVRIGPELINPNNLQDKFGRIFAIVPFFLLIAFGFFMYVLVVYFIPGNSQHPYAGRLLLALNHSELVGAASAAIFALIGVFSVSNMEDNLPWADDVGFGLLYLGLIGFILGFVIPPMTLHMASIMGIGILFLITVYFMRLP